MSVCSCVTMCEVALCGQLCGLTDGHSVWGVAMSPAVWADEAKTCEALTANWIPQRHRALPTISAAQHANDHRAQRSLCANDTMIPTPQWPECGRTTAAEPQNMLRLCWVINWPG